MAANIFLPQNISLIGSLLFVVTTTGVIFTVRYWYKVLQMKKFFERDSVLIFGEDPKSKPLINKFSAGKILSYAKNKDIKFTVPTFGNRQLQFVEVPFSMFKRDDNEIIRKLNSRSLVFFLGNQVVESAEDPVKRIETIRQTLGEKPSFLVVDKLKQDLLDKKLNYEVFTSEPDDLNVLKERLFSTLN